MTVLMDIDSDQGLYSTWKPGEYLLFATSTGSLLGVGDVVFVSSLVRNGCSLPSTYLAHTGHQYIYIYPYAYRHEPRRLATPQGISYFARYFPYGSSSPAFIKASLLSGRHIRSYRSPLCFPSKAVDLDFRCWRIPESIERLCKRPR